MEANEAQELQENAEHGSESGLKPVAFTMAVLAVLVAVVTVLGHRTHTEAVLKQAEASDKWNEYQAVKVRDSNKDDMTKLLSVLAVTDADKAKAMAKANTDHREKWAEELVDLSKDARGLEEEVKLAERHANFFDLGEALLEIGLVITSVTLLTRSRIYWYIGFVFSLAGIASALAVLFIK
jgi:Na+-transporting methylmalonyl-CoA/oxaloacetate decarboxylase gamma subunit